MHVDKPLNIDDSDLAPNSAYARPINIPTDMAYAHSWYSIAEISRQVTDALSSTARDPDDMPYAILLDLDQKFTNHLTSLPAFLRSDPKSVQETQPLHSQRPLLTHHRDMVQLLVHSRLYRLHRPYLTLGSRDPRYSYSRTICLRSARLIVETTKKLTSSWGPTPLKLWTVIHHVLVAALVLVVDYCLNRSDPRAAERKEEILDCFRYLEGCREHSGIARRGLGQLKELFARGFATGRDSGEGRAGMGERVEGARCSVPGVGDGDGSVGPSEGDVGSDPVAVYPATMAVPAPLEELVERTMLNDQFADADLSFENMDFEDINFDMGDETFASLFEFIEGSKGFFG